MKPLLFIITSIFFIFIISPVSAISWSGGGSNISTFLDLTDTPASYSGQAGLVATVNPGETALIFSAGGGGGGGITNISEAGDVNTTGVVDDDVLRWDNAVKKWIDSKMNSILTFGSNFLFFSANNEISFNETKLNETIDDRNTNVSIEHGSNGTNIIPILLTAEGKQIIVMNDLGIFENDVFIDGNLDVTGNISLNGSVALYSNSTCTFVPSPDGSFILEVCDA